MIGEKIKERRKQLGLTQEQLAKLIGAKKTSISNYELNLNKPTEDTILKIMQVLNCDANYLFGDFSNKKSATPESVALMKINEVLNELTDDEIDKLYDYVEFLLWQRNQS